MKRCARAVLCSLAPALALVSGAALAGPPQLEVPHGQLRQAALVPNFLLNLSLTFDDAGAAYRGQYSAANLYQGYFNPRLCYRYPLKSAPGVPRQPDLDPLTGHFSPVGPTGARHACGPDAFSGNLMNWAATSTLDLLRYGLTGGDRVIDEPGFTVLQRAWLPDGAVHADFYANALHFPRKSISGADAAGLTPFAADILYIVSCRNRVLFSATQKGSSCDAPRFGSGGKRLVSDKYFGEFNLRVSVCTQADSASRPDLCQPYGATHKPEGEVQKSAMQLRTGVMSYLTEFGADDPALYGGALRVPLRHAGPETDRASGVAAQAGGIDVINRIGRSNPARLGAYKSTDPGAEMYYEALRYLQARPPSVAAGGAADDGLPLALSRADPVLGACQRNIIATIGHSAFSGDRQVPGNTRAVQGDRARAADAFAEARFDVMEASRAVGAFEADRARVFGNPAPRPELLALDTLDDGPGGAGSFYLAGAAYWAHVNPVRRDIGIKVDSFSLELGGAGKQARSALYLAAKYGAFNDRNGDANPFTSSGAGSEWSADGATPTHFYQAAYAQDVVDAVRALFAGAGPVSAGASGPAAAWRGKDGAFTIQTGARPASVRRHALAIGAQGDAGTSAQPVWDAAALLNGQLDAVPPVPPSPAPGKRNIHTFTGSATVPFTWAGLPPPLRAALGGAGDGEALTAYLRGDRQREMGQPGGIFRKRDGVLGDINHSVPLIAGAPAASGAEQGHAAFRDQFKDRPLSVYVGAADGMLHAFSAADGREMFAYVPRALLGALGHLADPSFEGRAYVDGSAGQGDALVGGRWRSVLGSGMGMGARGVFALDITDPGAFGQGLGALWEFTEKDDPAMGHVHAAPQVVKLNTAARGGVPVYRYFLLVASGINSLAADGNGVLFLLALDKPAAQSWQAGVNYHAIATSGASTDLPNALSAPGLVTAADGSAILAYAGDLQGRLWRFDLAAKTARHVFDARDDAGRAQPISHAPRVVFAPGAGYLVLFGTGKLLEQADLLPSSFRPQSMYAFHDRLEPSGPSATRAQMTARTLSGTGDYVVKGAPVDYFGPRARLGWYLDFAGSRSDGERLAASPAAVDGAVIFSTMLPGADACASASSRVYALDALSGLVAGAEGIPASQAVTGKRSAVASLLAPLLLETGLIAARRDATGAAVITRSFTVLQPQLPVAAGPGGPATGAGPGKAVMFNVRSSAKRLGWREVSNWQELHEAAKR